jgi:hypothetical protein
MNYFIYIKKSVYNKIKNHERFIQIQRKFDKKRFRCVQCYLEQKKRINACKTVR